MRKALPNIYDIRRKQFENHFSIPPSDPIFTDEKKVFIITGIEAGGGWTFGYNAVNGMGCERTGSGDKEFYFPVTAASITNTTGIQRLVGFWLGP